MQTVKSWIVRNIIGDPIDGYSRVTISNENFNLVRGVKPSLAYTAQGDQGGLGVRIFTAEDGVKLYSSYNKDERKSQFFMEAKDAQKCLMTLVQQRANEPKLAFNVASFNTAIVASV